MAYLEKLRPLGLVVASAVIINFGYIATNLYNIPEVISVILIPCTLILCLGWFQRSMKNTIVLSLSVLLLSAILTQLSLTTPVLFGIIQDVFYGNLFVYTVFLRVVQYLFITTFFGILTALVAGLAFE
ncbi:hypothetical protein MUO93_06830 [Candidatus Bathyarchaeota archaeon]|nr:hypothetical protein [Candidatus Bathyarchaeota archaeon]